MGSNIYLLHDRDAFDIHHRAIGRMDDHRDHLHRQSSMDSDDSGYDCLVVAFFPLVGHGVLEMEICAFQCKIQCISLCLSLRNRLVSSSATKSSTDKSCFFQLFSLLGSIQTDFLLLGSIQTPPASSNLCTPRLRRIAQHLKNPR